jgi:hypothetical protein
MIDSPIHYLDHIGIVVSDLGRGLESLEAVVGRVVLSERIDDGSLCSIREGYIRHRL